MTKQMSAAAAVLGKKGGKAGRGKSKVRGDADYYKALALKRWGKGKSK
jgi:hypothetical protein